MAGLPPHDRRSLRALPGARLHCALLTALTVAVAALTGWSQTEAALRPMFFGLLLSFFRTTARRYPHIRDLPMRLVETGFLVLLVGSIASGIILLSGAQAEVPWLHQLRIALDRGAIFLLGMVLLAYGLLLWIPLVLESHRQLEASYARTRGALQRSESERSHMEQRLLESHRLSMLGELAAGVAHDLRNPLTIVKGAAEALLRRQRSPDAVADHARIICRGVEKADRTIQALIDLGRPPDPASAAVPLAELGSELLALVQVEGRRRALRFVTRFDGHRVLADRELLMQILVNLLLNAVQASPNRGTVALRARRCRLGAQPMLAIAVEDRGPGLPAEVRRQLFTPFFTTRPGGTGLGLLSSRRLATQMGGNLGLYPRSRGGARALLLLPVPEADRDQPAAAAELPVHRAAAPGEPPDRLSAVMGARR